MDGGALAVGLAALATALATGLGAAPFRFLRPFPAAALGVASAAAAGFMLAASAGLVVEGVPYGAASVLLGAALGAVAIAAAARYLRRPHAHPFGAVAAADASRMLLIVLVMTAHSFTEGIGVGVAFAGGERLGVAIALAIAVHNIPEGLAISLVLVPRGASVLAAAGWSVFSSLPQPLLAVPAYLLVDRFLPVLPIGLGFAAGAMAWMAVVELLPDARRTASRAGTAAAVAAAATAMLAFQALLLWV